MSQGKPFDEALALHQAGRITAAEAIYRRVLQEQPNHPGALHLLGVVRQQQADHEAALELIGRAISLNPNKAVYHNNHGAAFQSLGRFEEARARFQRALAICPSYADALANLGMAETALGNAKAALDSLQKALHVNPQHLDALKRCATLLKKLDRGGDAVAIYERALAERPTAEIHLNYGELLYGLRQQDLAIDQYRRAIELTPDLANAHFNLGNVLTAQGRIEEADAHLRRAVELTPDSARMHSNWLFCQQYRAVVTPAGLAAAHAEWDRRHAAPLRSEWRPCDNDRQPQRPLRLGFVSNNFRQHPVGCLTVRALEALKPYDCKVVCYSDTRQRDAITKRFMAAADHWLDLGEMSDKALAEQIRSDRIDVLFDLGGHLSGNRLLAFAPRPAPVQVKWGDYPGSTGLTAMDYLLADKYHVAAGEDTYQPEKLLRLPDGYACFDPPEDSPETGPVPALGQGHVTFGSFNNPAKITPSVVAAWAEILRRVPGARLLLRFAGFEQAGARRCYEDLFSAGGIGPDRLELRGWSPRGEMLADYRVDLALDPFPYSGGVTTCEALWMGVPVITCPGKTFAGRHSLSHLSNAGLIETVARSIPDYIDLAVELANALPRLAKWRAELRGQMAGPPLCDGPRIAHNLMKLLRSIWEEWITSPSSGET